MKNLKLILFIFVIIILHILLVNLNINQGSNFYNKQNEKNVFFIHDIFSFLPNLSKNELALNLLNMSFLLIFLLPFKGIIEFTSIFLIIFFIRHIFINLTILPPITELKEKTLVAKYLIGHDFDKIFSGHFAYGFLLTLILYKYKIIVNIPILVIYNIFNAFLILSTKSHYTIDLAVSFIVTLLVFLQKWKIPRV